MGASEIPGGFVRSLEIGKDHHPRISMTARPAGPEGPLPGLVLFSDGQVLYILTTVFDPPKQVWGRVAIQQIFLDPSRGSGSRNRDHSLNGLTPYPLGHNPAQLFVTIKLSYELNYVYFTQEEERQRPLSIISSKVSTLR